MNNRYEAPKCRWTGRIDGEGADLLRWHQTVEYIDLDNDRSTRNGFCIIGFESDLGIKNNKGRPGSALAPMQIRKFMASLPWNFDKVRLFDAGNVICENNLSQSQSILSDKVKQIMDSGLFPIVIGGGHDTALGSVLGSYGHFLKMPEIINFDAHFDMRPYRECPSSGTMFRQIADRCKEDDQIFSYLCMGIGKSANSKALFNDAAAYDAEYIPIEDIRQEQWRGRLKKFIDLSNNIHLTVCSDVFDQSIAPGVSAPRPFGLSQKEFIEAFNAILASKKVRSFDIAEVSPALDVNDSTSRLAAAIIFMLIDKISFK